MGFFDKVKSFFGGHGVNLVITQIEGASPESVQFPLQDSVLKGRIEVHSTAEAIILKHGFRVTAILNAEDTYRSVIVAEEFNEGEILGSDVSWPYTTVPGEVVHDSFCIIRVDIENAMRELGLEPDAALNDPRVTIELKAWADVKGSPMDAAQKVTLPIVEGGQKNSYAAPEEDASTNDIPARTQPLPLDPTPYRERFDSMVEGLRENPLISVLEYQTNPPATDAELAQAEAYLGQPLPEAMRRFYTQTNGLKLKWALNTAGEDRSPHGNIDLLPIQNVFSDWQSVIYFDEEWDDGRFKPVHPLDFFVPEACAALYLDGSGNPTIHYHYCGEELATMDVGFAGYLELLLMSRGYWYWQTAVSCDLAGREYTTSPREFRLNMPGLFDDYDPGFFLTSDYSQEDADFMQKQRAEGAQLRQVLEAAGVRFAALDEHGLQIEVLDEPSNMQLFAEAFQEISPYSDLSGDWGMVQVGSYQISRADGLNA